MAFLYPLVWIGALAVAVPVVLHLRRRSDSDVVRFSALRFLDDQPVAKRESFRLRDLLLLAIRSAALLLLLGAFSWPYLHRKVVTESRVYILDNTLSHQADGGFERARDALLSETRAAGAAAQVAVVELTSRPRLISAFGDSSQAVAEALRAIEPSFERGSYGEAFRHAISLLAHEPGSRKRLFVYGDSQENQWDEVLKGQAYREHAEVVLVGTKVGDGANLSLARPQIERTIAGKGTIVDFAVELHHRGAAGTAVWTLVADGHEIESGSVDFAAEAGMVLLTAQWETDSLTEIGGEVRVSGPPDVLSGDDRLHFSVPTVSEGTVALLARSPYLRAALSPDVMSGFWDTRLVELERISADMAAGRFADVLCVESDYFKSPEVRALVLEYLAQDRGVLLLVNRATPLVRSFLRRIGLELLDPRVATSEDPTFRYVDSQHPVFRPFQSPGFGSLAEIKVVQYSRLVANEAKPLIFSQSGDPLFLDGTNGTGRLLVSAFGFDREDTDWPLHATFIPFLDRCLQSARDDRRMPTTFEPGQVLTYDLPPNAAVSQFVLHDGDDEVLRGPVSDRRIRFVVPRKPGLYSLTYDVQSPLLPKYLSVNPSPLESELAYLASVESTQAGVNDLFPEAAAGLDTGLALAHHQILQQQYWWFALLAALVLLSAESIWLTVRRKRA